MLPVAAAGLILLPLWAGCSHHAGGSGTKLDKKLLREKANMSVPNLLSTVLAEASEQPSKCAASEGLLCAAPRGLVKPLGWGSAAALEKDSAASRKLETRETTTAVFSILLRNSICICSCVRAVCITSEDEVLV